MRIEDLSQIRSQYDHVYLSPHLDDAALSCGGRIVAQRSAGQRVLVVTLCTASPPAKGPFSALARQFHADWGLPPEQVVAARLGEDRLAMERLDADYYWAGRLDAIYRYPQAYDSRESLFGIPAPDDPLFGDLRRFFGELRERFAGAAFYAPLGVGSHVDHLVTHAAIRDVLGGDVQLYEDLYYAVKPGALEQRMAELEGRFSLTTIAIDATLAQKISAIHAYASQLKELFGSPAAMERDITEYARRVRPEGAGYGERVWKAQA